MNYQEPKWRTVINKITFIEFGRNALGEFRFISNFPMYKVRKFIEKGQAHDPPVEPGREHLLGLGGINNKCSTQI